MMTQRMKALSRLDSHIATGKGLNTMSLVALPKRFAMYKMRKTTQTLATLGSLNSASRINPAMLIQSSRSLGDVFVSFREQKTGRYSISDMFCIPYRQRAARLISRLTAF
jgi:hypothetical protein